ncbi:hypothetical protein [Pelomonas cellulosilytica]|uniref:hypothetical protein n=1 Tax=Pelomonas cellulosilytica TaxID=2906762 RepID=UPI001F178BB2|nr:hypothetical protein [Pelomonas sp. P8]
MLIALAWWPGVGACAQELPRSPECRQALQALDEAEAVLADAGAASVPMGERQRQVASRLQPQRERVARACLGGLQSGPSPSQHTLVLPPPAWPEAPVARGVVRPPVVPDVPLPRYEPPVLVTHCNVATCFTSDGRTVTRVGPTVVGPRGACTVQGVFLSCP